MVQQEYTFEDNNHHEPKKSGIGKFIWNSEKREFLGRDGASWGKITLFYAIFYTCLGSFFVGLLAVFIRFMPTDRPTYIGEQSTMSTRGLNPGLGFRPQVDVEDHLISFNPTVAVNPNSGYKKYVDNLKNFLDASKSQQEEKSKKNFYKNFIIKNTVQSQMILNQTLLIVPQTNHMLQIYLMENRAVSI